MPLARYFFGVGAVLLALLFVLDAYLPKLPAAGAEAAAERPAIRIHSDRKWPDRIVFDTSIATVTPAVLAKMEADRVTAPVTAADVSADARVRETFAQFVAAPKRPETKPQRQRRVAKNRAAAPPTVLAAQQPRFGFFANSVW